MVLSFALLDKQNDGSHSRSDLSHEFFFPKVIFVPSDVVFLLIDGHVGIPTQSVDDEIDEVTSGARLGEVSRQSVQKHVLREGDVRLRSHVLVKKEGDNV